LSGRIQLLSKLRQEALDLERQMEEQRQEMAEKQKELKDLQMAIDSLDSKDPKHVSKIQALTCSMETGMLFHLMSHNFLAESFLKDS
jgi:chromosome segregation ATPase